MVETLGIPWIQQPIYSPSPVCPVRKHGEEWREATPAQPAGRSRVYLAILSRASARGA